MVYLPRWLVIWMVVSVFVGLVVSVILAFKLHWARWALNQEKQVSVMLQNRIDVLERKKHILAWQYDRALREFAEEASRQYPGELGRPKLQGPSDVEKELDVKITYSKERS